MKTRIFLALDDDGRLTEPHGVNMAEFPLEPMIAKMLLVSGRLYEAAFADTEMLLLNTLSLFVKFRNFRRVWLL